MGEPVRATHLDPRADTKEARPGRAGPPTHRCVHTRACAHLCVHLLLERNSLNDVSWSALFLKHLIFKTGYEL